MKAWLERNALPIAIVLLASVVVIGAWELLDAYVASEPLAAPNGSEALTIGGLIKVTLFLLVPGLITLAIRRRQRLVKLRNEQSAVELPTA